MNKITKHTGELAIFLSTVLWGLIGIFTRQLSSMGFSPIQNVAVRAFFTTISIALFILFKDKKLFKIRLRDYWIFLGTGLCSFLFFNICYMTSITENSLSVACILMYTSPVWVTIISAFVFKEKFTKRKALSLLLCFAGCIAVCCSSTLILTKKGLIVGLLSGLGYALYSIFGKFAALKYSPFTTIFYTFLITSIGIIPLCNITQTWALLNGFEEAIWSIGISLVNTLLPYLLYTYGLSKTTPGKASILAITEPVVASLVGVFCFGELLGPLGVIGIATVFVGLTILNGSKNN